MQVNTDFPSAHQIRKRTLPPSAFIEVVRPKRTNIESLVKIVVLLLSCCFKQQEQHTAKRTRAQSKMEARRMGRAHVCANTRMLRDFPLTSQIPLLMVRKTFLFLGSKRLLPIHHVLIHLFFVQTVVFQLLSVCRIKRDQVMQLIMSCDNQSHDVTGSVRHRKTPNLIINSSRQVQNALLSKTKSILNRFVSFRKIQ